MNSINIICHITLILCIHYIQTYKNTLDCIYIKHKYFYLHQHCGTLVFKCAVVKKLSKEIYEDLLEVTTYFYFVSHQLTRIMLVIFYGFSATWNNLRLLKNHDITRRKTKVPIINLDCTSSWFWYKLIHLVQGF